MKNRGTKRKERIRRRVRLTNGIPFHGIIIPVQPGGTLGALPQAGLPQTSGMKPTRVLITVSAVAPRKGSRTSPVWKPLPRRVVTLSVPRTALDHDVPNRRLSYRFRPGPRCHTIYRDMPAGFLEALGGEAGCRRLSAEFYGRVGKDPLLRALFPGKSLRCATEEFAAFLIQFLGGDEEQTQQRWWLSLRESHARFQISSAERSAWLKHMAATLADAPLDQTARTALQQFFLHSSAYVVGKEAGEPEHEELRERWNEQRVLDDTIKAIASGADPEAVVLARRFVTRPSVFVGLLARMLQSGRAALIHFVSDAVESDPSLKNRRFSGRMLLHFAAGAGCLAAVALLLRSGADPNVRDRGEHTPLYCVANECASDTGAEIVRLLVDAGADVGACGGATRATPLHLAARRDFLEIARALLDCGASIDAKDRKGDTPLRRAINCRSAAVAGLLVERGARA